MSTVTPAATPVPATGTASAGVGLARAAIISAFLALAALAVAVAVLWQPWSERNQIGYTDIAPHRDTWLGTVVNGLGFAVVGIALGLAVCVRVLRRGSTWANIGAVASGLAA
jgi:hypothetical protein